MKLVVIRHAKAEDPNGDRWPDDSQRPLTEQGIERFSESARGLAKLVTPEVLLTSPYVRAKQTALILNKIAGWPEPRESPMLASAAVAQQITEIAMESDRSLAIVGHEPTLSRLIASIATGSVSGSVRMKPGAAALLEIFRDALPELSGELIWLTQPRLTREMA